MAHPRHEEVRRLYDFRCGYCGVSETDCGVQLTVDHFQPVSAQGGDDLSNLVYACYRCNLYKSAFFPTPAEAAQGIRLLHPHQDNIPAHIQQDPATFALIALTITGKTHIETLQLNRPKLIAHRRQRHYEARAAVRIESLEATIQDMAEHTRALQEYIQLLENPQVLD